MSVFCRYPLQLAGLSLLTGFCVYLTARPTSVYAVEIFQQLPFAHWTAALPSFSHTLGFGLLCALAGHTRYCAGLLACAWGGLEIGGELMQIGKPETISHVFDYYRYHSTFDILDVGAIILATGLTLMLTMLAPGARAR